MIEELDKNNLDRAVEILTECFSEDPLHVYAFNEPKERIRITKLIYEFVLKILVPEMYMKIYGYFSDIDLKGVIVFSPHNENRMWNENLQKSLEEMQQKAQCKRVNLISEFANKSLSIKYPLNNLYINELGVEKKSRGKGIGKCLIEFAERVTLKSGLNVITLDTSNPKNVNLYNSWGYEIFTQYTFFDITCYKLFKKLSK